MKLYRPYSIVPASRLEGSFEEENVRVDWICHQREAPVLPYEKLIKDFSEIEFSAKNKNWIEERVDNLLTEPEMNELKTYLAESNRFGLSRFPVDHEEFSVPIDTDSLALFKEKYRNADGTRGCIFLFERAEEYDLSIPIIGVISPFKELKDIQTVGQMLAEIDKHKD